MNDRQRQQLVEQCEEAELTLLMYDYAREEGRQLAKEYDEAQKNGTLPEVPEELDRKCRALIDGTFAKMERKTRLKRIVRSAAKAAAVLFVVLGVMATTVMSVDALRVPVINFIMDQSGRFSTIKTDDAITDDLDNLDILQRLESCLPDGFQEVQRINTDHYISVAYVNDEEHSISLNGVPASDKSIIDTENAKYSDVQINGYSAVFLEKDKLTVIWSDQKSQRVYIFSAKGLEEYLFWEMVYSIII